MAKVGNAMVNPPEVVDLGEDYVTPEDRAAWQRLKAGTKGYAAGVGVGAIGVPLVAGALSPSPAKLSPTFDPPMSASTREAPMNEWERDGSHGDVELPASHAQRRPRGR